MPVDYGQRKYPNRLKVIRQNAGLQQRQVAAILGHNSAIRLCDWENERIMPSGTHLIKLCILYGKDIRELYPEYYQRVAHDISTL